jgi:hypothetical protein
MQKIIEDAEFRNKPFDAASANTLIGEAQALLSAVP